MAQQPEPNAICRSDLCSGAASFLHRRRRLFGEVLGRFSYFLERARLDLPDAFARYVELCRKIVQRQWFVGQMTRLEDATFAVVQDIDRGDQCGTPVVLLILFDDDGFRRGRFINEIVLPFFRIAMIMDRRIDRARANVWLSCTPGSFRGSRSAGCRGDNLYRFPL